MPCYRNSSRMGSPARRWIMALSASLLVHLLFLAIQQALPVAEVPKIDLSQSMTVTLTSAAIKSPQSEATVQTEPKTPPPKPPTPRPPPKVKPVTSKPVIPKSVESDPPKPIEARPPEPSEAQNLSTASKGAQANSAAPGTTPAADSTSGHFEGPRLNADYLHNPRPDYPAQAKRMGWEGRVVLRVEVLANGSAGAVSIAKSSGHEILDEAALEAVRRWKFVPAKRDGTAVNSSVNVPINFNLKNE